MQNDRLHKQTEFIKELIKKVGNGRLTRYVVK